MTGPGPLDTAELTPRARELVDTARQLLEDEGPDGLSMRRLGQRLGISAPALYRYFPDKRTLENAIIFDALWELGDRLHGGEGDVPHVCERYRHWGLEHPHLYGLIHARPLDRDGLDPRAEAHADEAFVEAVAGDPLKARAVSVFAHGMVSLELDGRFPKDTDVDALWAFGAGALS